MRLAYIQELTSHAEVPVTANDATDAETIAGRAFQQAMNDPILTLRVQGKDLGRVEDWQREPVQKRFVAVATLAD